jgi:hypothetical protein
LGSDGLRYSARGGLTKKTLVKDGSKGIEITLFIDLWLVFAFEVNYGLRLLIKHTVRALSQLIKFLPNLDLLRWDIGQVSQSCIHEGDALIRGDMLKFYFIKRLNTCVEQVQELDLVEFFVL